VTEEGVGFALAARAMMTMKKFGIAVLRAAYEGN
jgi:hypothetical protein